MGILIVESSMIVLHRLKESNKARRRVRRVGMVVVEESWGDVEGWGGRVEKLGFAWGDVTW